jgi:hypothetical protein
MFIPDWAAQTLLGALLAAAAATAGWLSRRHAQHDDRIKAIELHLIRDTTSRGDFTTMRSEILTLLQRIEDKVDTRLTSLEKDQADLRVDVAVVEQRSIDDK